MANQSDADRARHEIDRRRHPLLLLRLRLAVRGWSLFVPIVAQQSNLQRLLAWTGPGKQKPYRGLGAETIWRCCHGTVKHPMVMRDRPCLREGLLLNRYLVMAGFEPTLHFGIDKDSIQDAKVRAHCWVCLGERVFNPPAASMVEIHAHIDHGNGASAADGLLN